MIFKTIGEACTSVQIHRNKESCAVSKTPFNLYGVQFLYHYFDNHGNVLTNTITDALHTGFKNDD